MPYPFVQHSPDSRSLRQPEVPFPPQHIEAQPVHNLLHATSVGRKVIMSHFAQSNSEPLTSTVMPFCAKADNASEGSMDVHPCTHRPGSVTTRDRASPGN